MTPQTSCMLCRQYNVSMQVWSKSIHWFRRQYMNPLFWTFHSAGFFLKIRSRSPKSNQLFPFSKQCIYASLVKIHQVVQKITHGNPILDIQSVDVTLKITPRSPKSNYSSPPPNNVSLQVWSNPSTSSEDRAQKPFF